MENNYNQGYRLMTPNQLLDWLLNYAIRSEDELMDISHIPQLEYVTTRRMYQLHTVVTHENVLQVREHAPVIENMTILDKDAYDLHLYDVHFPKLQSLRLVGLHGLPDIMDIPKLQQLEINDCKVDIAGISGQIHHWAHTSLFTSSLHSLLICNQRGTLKDDDLRFLSFCCDSLRILDLTASGDALKDGVVYLAGTNRNLEFLKVTLSSNKLANLPAPSGLLNENTLDELAAACPNIRHIILPNQMPLTRSDMIQNIDTMRRHFPRIQTYDFRIGHFFEQQ